MFVVVCKVLFAVNGCCVVCGLSCACVLLCAGCCALVVVWFPVLAVVAYCLLVADCCVLLAVWCWCVVVWLLVTVRCYVLCAGSCCQMFVGVVCSLFDVVCWLRFVC